MIPAPLPCLLDGRRIHLVGAKGTGMAALAEILASRGCILSGSDTADTFYTDAILAALGIVPSVGFDASHLPPGSEYVIHSAAYSRLDNPELMAAVTAGVPVMTYPEALGILSATMRSTAIAGVHGKTTTTAMAGAIISALGLDATVLAGSAVSNFGGHSTLIHGTGAFVAETCEYRRHFLHFHPSRMVVTSIESDHQDYYPRYEDILAAFVEFGQLLPTSGIFIYCADDKGAAEAATILRNARKDIVFVPYGHAAEGLWRLENYSTREGVATFELAGIEGGMELHVPGHHLALDATAATIIGLSLLADENCIRGSPVDPLTGLPIGWHPTCEALSVLRSAIAAFSGSKRRSEILGEAGGVLFMDDYGHHPTAIRETLKGIREFWPRRRLIVDFMSHTYSRTRSLFSEFARCLDGADLVILHKIYASAREEVATDLAGRDLFDAVSAGRGNTLYVEEPADAFAELRSSLRPGDLFLTMGAGDNWKLGAALYADRKNAFPEPEADAFAESERT